MADTYWKRKLSLIVFVFIFLVSTSISADITFQVIMSVQEELGNFDPVEDDIVVIGDFNNWGDNGSGEDLVCNQVDDSLWAATSDIAPGFNRFRYSIKDGFGNYLYESCEQREIVAGQFPTILDPVYFNDQTDINTADNKFGIISPTDPIITAVYPNPFNNYTTINVILKNNEVFNISFYDLSGREILAERIFSRYDGNNSIIFNASSLQSGIYLCRVETGNFQSVEKLVLIK